MGILHLQSYLRARVYVCAQVNPWAPCNSTSFVRACWPTSRTQHRPYPAITTTPPIRHGAANSCSHLQMPQQLLYQQQHHHHQQESVQLTTTQQQHHHQQQQQEQRPQEVSAQLSPHRAPHTPRLPYAKQHRPTGPPRSLDCTHHHLCYADQA